MKLPITAVRRFRTRAPNRTALERPGDQPVEIAVTVFEQARRVGQQLGSAVKADQELAWGQRSTAGRGELEGQREPVEAMAEFSSESRSCSMSNAGVVTIMRSGNNSTADNPSSGGNGTRSSPGTPSGSRLVANT